MSNDIPGLGLPADPQTGLPAQILTAKEFWPWMGTVAAVVLCTIALGFGLCSVYTIDADAPVAATQTELTQP